jgi:hypothetical protein
MKRLTGAQREAIANNTWVGWDAAELPVLEDEHGRYAVSRRGERTAVTEPIATEIPVRWNQ